MSGYIIDIREITDMITDDEITEMIADDLEDMMTDIYTDLTAPPPVGTPVDTGAARNSWNLDLTIPLEPEVWSNSPYMNRLNQGHSQQSPSGFIDTIVDKHTS